MRKQLTIILAGAAILAGCAQEEQPPRTVTEFVENPNLLEAAMVRCSRDRSQSRYDAECVNARQAVKIVESKEEEIRRAELEKRSQAEARRRAEFAEQQRKEAEYLAQFGVPLPKDEGDEEELPEGNVPLAVVPESGSQDTPVGTSGDALPATDGGNAPVMEAEPVEEDDTTSLQDVRNELRRRNEDDDGNN